MTGRSPTVLLVRGALIAGVALLALTSSSGPGSLSAQGLRPGGHGRLIKTESFEKLASGTCAVPAAMQMAALREMHVRAYGAAGEGVPAIADPIRRIRDPYPAFAAVSVDAERDEVVLTDENLFQVLVFSRTENTPADAEASTPRRTIAGPNTEIEFQSGVHVDPASGEIYAVNNDTRDKLVVFGPGAKGDVTPVRAIETPHGTFGVTFDRAHRELLLSVQHDSAIVTFRKQANGDEAPVRSIQGDRTQLADPHGLALDPVEDVVFAANYGSRHNVDGSLTPRTGVPGGGKGRDKAHWPFGREYSVPGSGTIGAPSITVHRRTASGNAAPLRVISGPNTQLNWPTGLAFDPDRRELYVANDMGPSILVFDASASGDAAPKRVLEGPNTGLANPTGVFVDRKHGELWVANFGGHSATVYDITAAGNTRPKRAIRSAPADAPSLMIGNPGALAYDSKREQLLVPN